MPESTSRRPQNQPWENNWTPDTSRVPGTRRLWLAGALALATIVACVTAISVMQTQPDEKSPLSQSPAADEASIPGLISFATPSASATTTPPGGKGALPSAEPTRTTSHRPTTPTATASKSPVPHTTSPAPKPPSTTWRSLRSVNYPDHYWRVSHGRVTLEAITSSSDRRDATFKLVQGLAASSCHSFVTADGSYLRHRDFELRADRHDGSRLFQQDATFCPRSTGQSGVIMLESVNYPGRFLRHQNFRLRLDEYRHGDRNFPADSAFRLVDGLS
ncbi:AbfB domain-containing protein [Streptomyces sp. KR55]|uniref:AbfB domain-containing protein n=1 Tax=Streptomyces sp. KR55 TaxID=3457425 RepID=UPI003FD04BAD